MKNVIGKIVTKFSISSFYDFWVSIQS